MKRRNKHHVDATSTLVAGGIGAFLMALINQDQTCNVDCGGSSYGPLLVGFLVGAGVQVGLRVSDVS